MKSDVQAFDVLIKIKFSRSFFYPFIKPSSRLEYAIKIFNLFDTDTNAENSRKR